MSNKNSAGKKKIMEFPERGARVRGEEKVEERGPRYSRGLAGQVSRGARSAADHFDPRPHQSSPNHTPLISTRRGTKAVHVLHVMHVTARAHAPLSLSLSLRGSRATLHQRRFPLTPTPTLPLLSPARPSISTRRWSRVLVIGLRGKASWPWLESSDSRSMFGNIGRIIEIVDRTLRQWYW